VQGAQPAGLINDVAAPPAGACDARSCKPAAKRLGEIILPAAKPSELGAVTLPPGPNPTAVRVVREIGPRTAEEEAATEAAYPVERRSIEAQPARGQRDAQRVLPASPRLCESRIQVNGVRLQKVEFALRWGEWIP
jgi:hypothetical protein